MRPRDLGRKRPLCRRRLTRQVNTKRILNKYDVKDTAWTEPGSGWIPKASPGGHGRVFWVVTPVSALWLPKYRGLQLPVTPCLTGMSANT
jgi:hypothetical protein